MKYFYFLFTVFFITCASGQSLQEDLMNFEPGQVIIKLKDNVNTKTTYNAQGKASSTLNLVEFLGITTEISEVNVMFSKKAIDRSLIQKEQMKQHSSQKLSSNTKDHTAKREPLSLKNIFHLKLTDAQNPALVMQLVEDLKSNPNVEFAEPNYRYRINDFEVNKIYSESELEKLSLVSVQNTAVDTNIPNDPLYAQQNNISQTNIQSVWDNYTTGNGSQIIAVLDTGVDYTHPDLAANIWTNQIELNGIPGIDNDGNGFVNDVRGWDFINQDNTPLDDNMHGTHVAGIAGAVGNNGIGLAGAAWNVKIMPIKVFQSSGVGNSSTIAEGVTYASVNGATIINMSFGSYAESSTLRAALENAYATSVLVAAAGNNGLCIGPGSACAPFFPGAYSYVLGVQDSPLGYTNYDQDGPIYSSYVNLLNYELRAPGTAIISTVPGGGYAKLTGTSMASPLVAGAIALYREQRPSESKELLFGNLINTSGSPFVDFYAALETTPQPLLKVLSVTMKDVINNQNGNGYFEPGETIELLPLVKNYWGLSNDVRLGIAFAPFEDTSKATILENEIQIGSVSAYATLQNLQQSLKIQLATSLANNVDIKFIVSVWSGPNQEYLTTKEIIINVKKAVLLFGLYTQDLTLTANSEYLVTGNLAMAESTVLTIEPGVIISFSDNTGMNIQGTVNAIGNSLNPITFKAENVGWKGLSLAGISNFQYCIFQDVITNGAVLHKNTNNYEALFVDKSVFKNNIAHLLINFHQNYVSKSNFYENSISRIFSYPNNTINFSNFITNSTPDYDSYPIRFMAGTYTNNNIFSNKVNSKNGLAIESNLTIDTPNYFGTSIIAEANSRIIDFFEDSNLGVANFNIATLPSEEANGIVWKILINDVDAQDAYALIDPLGIGAYEFKVYFNKAMNTSTTPQISYGVIAPYNQKIITEAGSWSADGKIYAVNHNIRIGVEDGINRIRVQNAKDLDNFEIPVEDRRFNFLLQSAGSASSGFMATPGIGKIELVWQELDEEVLADVLGYNMFRYQINSSGEETDVIQLNSSLIIPSSFVDFDVVEGQTYYYKYKILRTSFDETDFSQTISAQPLTSLLGDSNGDFTVNILDVLHDVDYILGNNPTPFVFLAADVNNDNNINVLDVVGTVDLILNPQSQSSSQNGSDLNYYSNNFVGNAILSWEGNDLFIESDFQIGGLQLAFNPDFQFTLSSDLPQLENVLYNQQDHKTLMLFSFNNESFGSGKIKILTKSNNVIYEEDIIRSAVTSTVSGNSLETSILNTTLGTIDAPVQGTKLTFSKIYPNPTSDLLFIEYYLPKNADDVTLTIYNIQGQRVKSIKDLRNVAGASKAEVNVESLVSGTYIIVLDALEDKGIQFRQFKKFVKK